MKFENLMMMTKKEIVDTRALATFVDCLFIIIESIIIDSIVNYKNLFIIFIPITLLYFISFESLFGFTIGKFIFGVRVINSECRKPTIYQSTIRALFWMIEVNPILIVTIVTFIITQNSKTKQRFGDKVSNVFVVRRKDLKLFLSNENYQSMDSEEFYEHFNKPKVILKNIDIPEKILDRNVILLYDNIEMKIFGLKGMSISEIKEEIEKGARFVVFKSCVSNYYFLY